MENTLAIPTTTQGDRRTNDDLARRLSRRYADALRTADAAVAAAVVRDALAAGIAPALVGARIIGPAMVWIGELWRRGAITVADEHLSTAISESCAAQLYRPLIREPAASRETVLVSAVEGEQHVLGARMAADVLEGAGYRTLFLGADVPTVALGAAAAGHRADVVCLSLYMPLGASRLDNAIAVVQETRPTAKIVLAGRGVPERLRAQFPFVDSLDPLLGVVATAVGGEAQPRVRAERAMDKVPETAPDSFEAGVWRATAQTADLVRETALDADRFERLAYEDALTGLPNRRAWEDRTAELASSEPMMVMVDVDRFKAVNDKYGHEGGDEALRRVAAVMRASLRPADFAARIGGDEFAVLLAGSTPYEAVCVADRLRTAMEQDETEPALTLSVGISRCGSDVRGATLAADEALYAAKRSGRNAVKLAQAA